MTRAFEPGDASITDEVELDRLIADEGAGVSATILHQLREELSAGEAQLRRMGDDLVAARDAQIRLDREKARLEAELDAVRGTAEGFKRERDVLDAKIRDMIKVSQAEMTKIIDHTERMQHLRFSQDEVADLSQRVKALEAALAAERAASIKHLEDLKGTQAHRDILEQKIVGMLSVMHAETQKIVDHTERQFASVVEGVEAGRRIEIANARSDALAGRELAAQATLEAVYRSTSWRLTKPWRFAGRMLARVGIKRGPR